MCIVTEFHIKFSSLIFACANLKKCSARESCAEFNCIKYSYWNSAKSYSDYPIICMFTENMVTQKEE